MLAEQLTRELTAGARPGPVLVGDEAALHGAAVAVRVIAGEPSDEDDAFVRAADRVGVPVVLVQLWPQPDWRAPFVLSPFVVECRTGEGFPIPEIAARITEAVESPTALAARVPVLADQAESAVIGSAVARSALLALSGAAGPAGIALEQLRLAGQLRTLDAPPEPDPPAVVAGAVAATLVASYGLRSVARSARRVLPAKVADPLVAAAGTFAFAQPCACSERGSRPVSPHRADFRGVPSGPGPTIRAEGTPRTRRDDGGHRAGRRATSARRGRRVVRIPRVDPWPGRDAVLGARAVGMGPPRATPARGPCTAIAPPHGHCLTARLLAFQPGL